MNGIDCSDRHPLSGRIAHVVDEGPALWMYLTDGSGDEIIADCWLQNQVPAPGSLDDYRAQRGAPPATQEFVSTANPFPYPETVAFVWSSDGGAVAVRLDGRTVGFIDCRNKFGFCRNLVKQGPYGLPFDEALFEVLFGYPA